MKSDISKILNDWMFEPGNNIRFIKGDDSREIMQIRLPLGIEQYELNGRPDGKKPFNKESYLKYYNDKINTANAKNKKIELSNKDFQILRNESLLYYYRYLILFQLGEYLRTISDTEHNLKICEIVNKHYNNENKNLLLQYLPYILRINKISQAMTFLQNKEISKARNLLKDSIDEIKKIQKINTDVFEYEINRSLKHMTEILKNIKSQFPEEKDILEEELKRAIELEDYKWAAEIRDKIKKINDDYIKD
ncbi:MAG: UvrB/UvrC motif-containing protein [Spirochaetes bacterium]|nr:UvrB/UvrC motif-containing protein [Spirochaetota bacterium]